LSRSYRRRAPCNLSTLARTKVTAQWLPQRAKKCAHAIRHECRRAYTARVEHQKPQPLTRPPRRRHGSQPSAGVLPRNTE
jgi:hypothetical protein